MTFRIQGIDPAPFRPLYGLDNVELKRRGAVRRRVDSFPGFPDRVEMRDIEVGGWALLVNHEHLAVASPYRSRHAIFLREGAEVAYDAVGVVPEVLARRLISLRAFDDDGFMIDAEVVDGQQLAPLVARMFDDPAVAFLHAHNAAPGCFAARIDRT